MAANYPSKDDAAATFYQDLANPNAVAAYRQVRRPPHQPQKWLRDAGSYYGEACEHAALADDSGEVLRAVREWMGRYIPRGAL